MQKTLDKKPSGVSAPIVVSPKFSSPVIVRKEVPESISSSFQMPMDL